MKLSRLRLFNEIVTKWSQKLKGKIDEVNTMKILRFWELTAFICSKIGDNYIAVRKEFVSKLEPWVQLGDWLYYVNFHNPTVELFGMRWFFLDSETGQTLPFIEIQDKLLDKSILDEILHTKTARNLTIQPDSFGKISLGERIMHIGFGLLMGFMIFYFLSTGGII